MMLRRKDLVLLRLFGLSMMSQGVTDLTLRCQYVLEISKILINIKNNDNNSNTCRLRLDILLFLLIIKKKNNFYSQDIVDACNKKTPPCDPTCIKSGGQTCVKYTLMSNNIVSILLLMYVLHPNFCPRFLYKTF